MTSINSLKDLQRIPGVGPRIALCLLDLGYSQVEDLKRENPEEMFHKLCQLRDKKIDRCVLYVFRETVYFASNTNHDAALLKWWNWKDRQ